MWGAPTWAWRPGALDGSRDPKVVPKVPYIYGGLRSPIISNRELQKYLGEPAPLTCKGWVWAYLLRLTAVIPVLWVPLDHTHLIASFIWLTTLFNLLQGFIRNYIVECGFDSYKCLCIWLFVIFVLEIACIVLYHLNYIRYHILKNLYQLLLTMPSHVG